MKYNGRMASLFIMAGIIIAYVALYFHSFGEHFQGFGGIIFILFLVVAWMFGSRYDMSKYYFEELHSSKEEIQHIFDSIDATIWSIDLINNVFSVSEGIEKVYGYDRDDFTYNPLLWRDAVHRDDLHIMEDALDKVKVGQESICEYRIVRKDGETRWIHSITTPFYDTEKNLVRANGINIDITERKSMEGALRNALEALKTNEEFLSDVFDSIQDGIAVIDRNFNIIRTNKTLDDWYEGALPIKGKKCYKTAFGENANTCPECPCAKAIEDGKPHIVISERSYPSKDKRWIEMYAYPLKDESGRVTGVIEQVRDISERKKVEDRINQMAYFDTLTGLPNRNMMRSRLRKAINHAKQLNGKVGVMFVDLDRFKMINDTMGHNYGDRVLRIMAQRLNLCADKDHVIFRHGGDEFIILVQGAEREEIGLCAQKLISKISEPLKIDGREIFITPSVGVSMYPCDGEDVDTLIKYADAAMYLAKEKGRNNYQFYNCSLNEKIMRKMNLENGLRKALENNEFILHYQPQVELSTGQMVGAEALIRWQSPEFGFVLPSEFIPVAEESGLIIPIGEWVLRSACAQNKKWQDQGYAPMKVAVNISALQFQQKDFVNSVIRILEETGLESKYLELEITEGMMINVDELLKILGELKSIGIKISVDDFGTGYSSLSVLRHLPIDILKIDKSFIKDVLSNDRMTSLVKTIIDMGYSLNFDIVAEGVETKKQAEFLFQNKCNLGQGYLFSRPLAVSEFEKHLVDESQKEIAVE